MIKFSDNQKLAFSTIDKNVCVNAGAGTGKTEVVSERFKYMYDSGVDIKKIVCITFTNKACDEMKDRIIKKLNNPKLIDDINVSTISSFCKKIVSDNSYYLSIDPGFQIFEENEQNKMVDEIVGEISQNNIDFIKSIGSIFQTNYSDTVGVVKSSYYKMRTNNVDFYELKNQTLDYLKSLQDFKAEDIIFLKSFLFDLKQECENIKDIKKNSKLYKFLNDERQLTDSDDYIRFLFESYNQIGDSTKENVREIIDEVNKKIEETLKPLEKGDFVLYEKFFELLIEIDEKYSEKKTELGVLDFNDIELMCKKVLENREILQNSKNKYQFFMIDEFQDTSNLQRYIFYTLCSDDEKLDRNNLFVVGDPKQAIYSFRGANIKVFNQTRQDIIKSGGEDITFYENHRTHPNIMEPINYIYSNKMKERYDKLIAKNPAGDVIGEDEFKKNTKDEKTHNDSCNVLVSYIDEKNFNDTAILARTKQDLEYYEQSLKDRNIPYYLFDKQGLEDCIEILNLIQFIKYARYQDDISKVGVLSNIYNIEYNDIINDTDDFKQIQKILDTHSEKFLNNLMQHKIYFALSNYIQEIKYFELLNDIQKRANVIKFLEIAKQFDSNNYSVDDFVSFFENNKNIYQMSYEDEKSNLVKLMTIHKSKGLGFKNVIVDNVSKFTTSKDKFFLYVDNENEKIYFALDFPFSIFRKNHIKDSIAQADEYENDNLYYTAFTRAKEQLSFSNSKNSGHFKNISQFVDDLRVEGKIKILNKNDKSFDLKQKNHSKQIVNPKKFEQKKFIPIGITNMMKNESTDNDKDSFQNNENINYILLGNLVHLYAKLFDGKNLVKLKETSFLNEKEHKIFEDAVGNFRKIITDFSNYKNEMDFNLMFENLMISGFMDRVEFYEDEIKVYDYKISSQSKQSLYEKYHIQLKFYAYVLNKKYKKKIKMVLVNLRKGYTIETNYNGDFEIEVEKFLNNYLKKLN
ncbi:exodeoxyribonuclease V subunit beta [uncultured Finegoldia sp.]|uniref:UvrD-helicase domain-containing protein n=1 Tax=uncultured Finegoldia sp. TaxID=328009 RepID=UPI00261FEF4E|nr:UvrD-helicase domain-containing protein [uncultured Finegoldia sp.]